MKKIMIMLVLGALAFAAQADLVDGTFTTDGAMPSPAGNLLTNGAAVVNQGWQTYSGIWEISGGQASRVTNAPNSVRGFGQIWTDPTLDGAYMLQFDYSLSGATASQGPTLYVNIVAWNALAGGAFLNNNRLSVGDTSGITTGVVAWAANDTTAYENILLAQYVITGNVARATYTVDFTASTAYEYYAVTFVSANLGFGAPVVMKIDNVAVAPVPEPATALLLGFGGLGAWMLRRNLRQAKEQSDE